MPLENPRQRGSILIGSLLIVGGIVLLLSTFGMLNLGALFWVGAFYLGGGIFLAVFLLNRNHWWALIPGMALLGVGTTIVAAEFFPAGSFIHEVAGAFVLFFVGLAFALIFLRDTQHWWPLIPMGALFSTAVIAGLATTALPGEVLGSLLFFGMALTFSVIAMLPSAEGQTRWAFIPAAILGLMGVLVAGAFNQAWSYLWPAVLIIGGLTILVVDVWRNRHSH